MASTKFKLTIPVTIRLTKEVEKELTLQPVTVAIARAGEDERNPEAKARLVIGAWTSLEPGELDQLAMKDYLKLQEIYYEMSGLKDIAEEAVKSPKE